MDDDIHASRTAAAEFSRSPELMDITIRECTWSSAVALTQVSVKARAFVFYVIRTRLRTLLSKFLPCASLDMFFDLLDSTNATIAGALVRCLMSIEKFHLYDRVHPLQLNLSVPLCSSDASFDGAAIHYRRWRRFLVGCGYLDECGSGYGSAPFHLSASASAWSYMRSDAFPEYRISLILSKTESPLSPIFQSNHTSTFFAMSSSRIYCMYPKLFAAKVNLNMRPRMPPLKCAFDSFNFGLVSFSKTDTWDIFPDGMCGEACPSVWRRIRLLKGVGVLRWGGSDGSRDMGQAVSEDDGYGDKNEIWKAHGECTNLRCPIRALRASLIPMMA